MPVVVSPAQPARPRGLIIWRIVVWLLLLFSAACCLVNAHHLQLVWGQLQSPIPMDVGSTDALHRMIGWDSAYLLTAFLLIIISAGCILLQGWARPVMRIVLVFLVIWLASRGWTQVQGLHAIQANEITLQSQVQTTAIAAIEQNMAALRRGYQFALLIDLLALPLLLWLSWKLGKPAVRAQFRTRR